MNKIDNTSIINWKKGLTTDGELVEILVGTFVQAGESPYFAFAMALDVLYSLQDVEGDCHDSK